MSDKHKKYLMIAVTAFIVILIDKQIGASEKVAGFIPGGAV